MSVVTSFTCLRKAKAFIVWKCPKTFPVRIIEQLPHTAVGSEGQVVVKPCKRQFKQQGALWCVKAMIDMCIYFPQDGYDKYA